jgi:hypothetical protein
MIKDDPPASTIAPPKSASTVPPSSMIPPQSVAVSSRRIRPSSCPSGSSRHYSTAPPPSRPAASAGALRKHARTSASEIRDLWGEEVFEVLVGIVMTMHSRMGARNEKRSRCWRMRPHGCLPSCVDSRARANDESAERKARRGLVAGGIVYGYRNVSSADGAGKVRAIDETQAAVVREVFERYAKGEGLRTICKSLSERGISSPRAGKRGIGAWAPSAVHAMLRRPHYIGRMEWGHVHKTYKSSTRVRTKGYHKRVMNEASLVSWKQGGSCFCARGGSGEQRRPMIGRTMRLKARLVFVRSGFGTLGGFWTRRFDRRWGLCGFVFCCSASAAPEQAQREYSVI